MMNKSHYVQVLALSSGQKMIQQSKVVSGVCRKEEEEEEVEAIIVMWASFLHKKEINFHLFEAAANCSSSGNDWSVCHSFGQSHLSLLFEVVVVVVGVLLCTQLLLYIIWQLLKKRIRFSKVE